jgi:hypothetical protein
MKSAYMDAKVRPSAGVPGPPFMPKATMKTDVDGTKGGGQDDKNYNLDSIGHMVFKTMPNVVCDEINSKFFSMKMLDILQNALIHEMRSNHGYIIDRQEDKQMVLLMRKVYLSNPFASSIKDLMNKTLKEALRIILPNIEYANIHLDLKTSSFTPLAYGISDNDSIRGR